MMRFLATHLVLLAFSLVVGDCHSASTGSGQVRNKPSANSISRLSPEAFAELPPEVMRFLESRRCTIPQTPFYTTPHNVVRGYFAQRGQTDWAVLCSRDDVSTILVFWGGAAERVAGVAPMDDRTFLVDTDGDGVLDYSRVLDSISQEHTSRLYDLYKSSGAPKPPLRITHQGISDARLGEPATVHYCHRGEWLRFRGDDG